MLKQKLGARRIGLIHNINNLSKSSMLTEQAVGVLSMLILLPKQAAYQSNRS